MLYVSFAYKLVLLVLICGFSFQVGNNGGQYGTNGGGHGGSYGGGGGGQHEMSRVAAKEGKPCKFFDEVPSRFPINSSSTWLAPTHFVLIPVCLDLLHPRRHPGIQLQHHHDLPPLSFSRLNFL
jgi:hypothetical protein